MKLFLFFVFISFFFDSKASNSINGEEIEGLVNEWLKKNNQSGNVKLLKSLKYPSCTNNNMIISDISGSFNLIKISCLYPNEWSLITRNKTKNKKSYSLQEKNKKKFNVITLKNPKSAGAVINEDDLIMLRNLLL